MKNRIEFGELRIGEVARQHLIDVCDTNWASGGPKVKAFEKQWNDVFSYTKSVAMSSGTDGVINACLALYDLKNAKRPSNRAKFRKTSHWHRGKKNIIGHIEMTKSVISI